MLIAALSIMAVIFRLVAERATFSESSSFYVNAGPNANASPRSRIAHISGCMHIQHSQLMSQQV